MTRLGEQSSGVLGAAELAEHQGFEIARVEIVRLRTQGGGEVFEGLRPLTVSTVDLGEAMIGRSAAGGIPCALIQGVVCGGSAALIEQCEAEVIVRLAVVGVGIACSEAVDGGTQMLCGQREFPAPQMPAAECVVGTAVTRV